MESHLKHESEKQAENEAKKLLLMQAKEEERNRKYQIVDKIRKEVDAKEAAKKISLVDSYALKAQEEFQQISMKELRESGNYSCPPKYLLQRDTPLEVPMECVRKLCDVMDVNYDDRVSLEELKMYIALK